MGHTATEMDGGKQSVMQRALGGDFARLHPELQRQYSIASDNGLSCSGNGVMSKITRGRFYVVPFLAIGAKRHCLFPETGCDVPFTIGNYAFLDKYGRETLTWTRSFEVLRRRRFDEFLIYSERRKNLVVYAGSHQHVAVDLKVAVDDSGALCIETGHQRLYEWRIGIPFPILLSGTALVRESYNDDLDRYEIAVEIRNRALGHIFGYSGWFVLNRFSACEVPNYALPMRAEERE